jgi:NAD(P)-dependent dehydrogenase (short-subunit alcohol dehydrogenase family)
MSMFDLTGKVALITGSSRGIGRAIAVAMAEHGAKVVVSSRKQDACEVVADEIKAAGGEAMVVPCNVSHHDQLRNLVDTTLSAWGPDRLPGLQRGGEPLLRAARRDSRIGL